MVSDMNGKIKPSAWILVSTKKELEPIIRFLNASSVQPFYDQFLWKIEDSRKHIYLAATTGIGKANAAFTAGALTEMSEKPQLIMNIGIAGTYHSPPVVLGDVVIVTECIMGDEGVWEKESEFLSYDAIGISPLGLSDEALYGRLSLKDSSIFKRLQNILPSGSYSAQHLLPPDILWNREELLASCQEPFNVWYGSSCSVGMASGSPFVAALRRQIYRALIEEMEVSSIALASFRMGIPFVALRGVSNVTGERERTKWEIQKAIFNASVCTLKILREIVMTDTIAKRSNP